MSAIRLIELTEGFSIPQLGLAAFRRESPEETKSIIKNALSRGLRYFEISELFCNGHIILEALSEANVNRSEVFLSLKVWPKDRTPAQLLETTKNVLRNLRLEYFDLILMHAPVCVEHRFEQWKTMEELKHIGLANIIGVANISMNELMTVMKNCDKLPSVIEMQTNISNQQMELVEFAMAGQVQVISSEPFAKGLRNNKPELVDIATAAGITVEQVMLRWACAKGVVSLLPPEVGFDALDLAENVFDKATMKILDGLDEELQCTWCPPIEEED